MEPILWMHSSWMDFDEPGHRHWRDEVVVSTIIVGVSIAIHLDMSRHPDARCVITAHTSTVGPLRLALRGILREGQDLMAHWQVWNCRDRAPDPTPMDLTQRARVNVLLESPPLDPEEEAILLMQVAKMEVTLLCANFEHHLVELSVRDDKPVIENGEHA